jgi:hypothetical protein
MAHKGYKTTDPYDCDKIDDVSAWYFYYHLPEGDLELEVFYDRDKEEWESTVTTFSRRPSDPTTAAACR